MKKLTSTMMLVCVITTAFTGCATRFYGIEVSNVPNVSRVYIRNAGTTGWGGGIPRGNMQNIDTSGFSESVDIRVVDATGAVFSRYNVPFDTASFAVTNRTSEVNWTITTLVLLAIGIPIFLVTGD